MYVVIFFGRFAVFAHDLPPCFHLGLYRSSGVVVSLLAEIFSPGIMKCPLCMYVSMHEIWNRLSADPNHCTIYASETLNVKFNPSDTNHVFFILKYISDGIKKDLQ